MQTLRKIWPHSRAALVLAHLVAIFVVGFPAPVGGLDRSMWKEPGVQGDLTSWSNFFHVSEPDFEEFLYRAAVVYMSGRDKIVGPFAQYVSSTGCEQPWRMFVGPQRYPSRLQIQVHRKQQPEEQWDTLFYERSPDHHWQEPLFGQERLRSQIFRWAWPSFSGEFNQGCTYVARLAFAEDANADAVRCRFFKLQSPSPEMIRNHTEPPGEWSDPHEIRRAPAGATP